MKKKIEIISATDPLALKPQLEQLVNNGWEIKGVIGYNPHNLLSEPFVILEHPSFEESTQDEAYYDGSQELVQDLYLTKPEPPRKEISISMG